MSTADALGAFVGVLQAVQGPLGAVVGLLAGLELVHFAVDLVRGR